VIVSKQTQKTFASILIHQVIYFQIDAEDSEEQEESEDGSDSQHEG